jgi:hypothetical protein
MITLKRRTLTCERCGCSELSFLARVNLNTNEIIHDFDLDGVKCDECGVIDSWELKETKTKKENK